MSAPPAPCAGFTGVLSGAARHRQRHRLRRGRQLRRHRQHLAGQQRQRPAGRRLRSLHQHRPDRAEQGEADPHQAPGPGRRRQAQLRELLHLRARRPTIDPVTNGVRFLVIDSTGAIPVDVTIPGGAYNAANKVGWKVNGSGTSWTYKNAGTVVPLVNGITKVQLKAIPRRPGSTRSGQGQERQLPGQHGEPAAGGHDRDRRAVRRRRASAARRCSRRRRRRSRAAWRSAAARPSSASRNAPSPGHANGRASATKVSGCAGTHVPPIERKRSGRFTVVVRHALDDGRSAGRNDGPVKTKSDYSSAGSDPLRPVAQLRRSAALRRRIGTRSDVDNTVHVRFPACSA